MAIPEHLARHLLSQPQISSTAYVAPGAVVLGDVALGEECSVWFGAVLRGDLNQIAIGAHSNIQDGAIVHLEKERGTVVGEWVTVGHRAILHACTVQDEVLVGMGSTILDGAEIGSRSIIGAGALVTGGKVIPPGSLVLGSPGKVVRTLSDSEQQAIKGWAERYVTLSRVYLQEGPQPAPSSAAKNPG